MTRLVIATIMPQSHTPAQCRIMRCYIDGYNRQSRLWRSMTEIEVRMIIRALSKEMR